MYLGGKQAKLRESTVLPDSLGDSKPKMYYIPGKGRGEWQDGPKWVDGPCPGAVEKDMSLRTGRKISHVFGPYDPPPWYDLKAPRFSRPRTAVEIDKETQRRKKAREQFLKKKQLLDPLTVMTPEEEERFQTSDTSKYPPIPGMCVCVCVCVCVCLFILIDKLINMYVQVMLVLPKEQSRWYGKGAAGDLV